MPVSKTRAVETYREEIAAYLEEVLIEKSWTQATAGEIAGVRHTTIGRALKASHTLGYPAIIALSERSGIPIPEGLTRAAIGAQQPGTAPPVSKEAVKQLVSEINAAPEDAQRAAWEALNQRFGQKAG